MVAHMDEEHATAVTVQDVFRNDCVSGLEPFTKLRQCNTCTKQHCKADYIEQHELVCRLAHETYRKWDEDEAKREEAATSSDATTAPPDVVTGDVYTDVANLAISAERSLYSEHHAESCPNMERFYYDQDCEFRQRPFEVATYGEIVPFVRDAEAGRLRLYMEQEVPPGLYDARDNDDRIVMSFSCCLHFQDHRRFGHPPIVSARNPTGYAWQATMLSARSSPAIVTSNVYLLFPALGVLHVTKRVTGENFGRMEVTADNLFDDCVCDQYYNLCPP